MTRMKSFADGVGESVVSVGEGRRVAAPAKQSVPK